MDSGAKAGSSSTSGPDRGAILTMKDGGAFDQGTRTAESSKCLDPTHLVTAGGVQDDVINTLWKDNADGLWNRFFVAFLNPVYSKKLDTMRMNETDEEILNLYSPDKQSDLRKLKKRLEALLSTKLSHVTDPNAHTITTIKLTRESEAQVSEKSSSAVSMPETVLVKAFLDNFHVTHKVKSDYAGKVTVEKKGGKKQEVEAQLPGCIQLAEVQTYLISEPDMRDLLAREKKKITDMRQLEVTKQGTNIISNAVVADDGDEDASMMDLDLEKLELAMEETSNAADKQHINEQAAQHTQEHTSIPEADNQPAMLLSAKPEQASSTSTAYEAFQKYHDEDQEKCCLLEQQGLQHLMGVFQKAKAMKLEWALVLHVLLQVLHTPGSRDQQGFFLLSDVVSMDAMVSAQLLVEASSTQRCMVCDDLQPALMALNKEIFDGVGEQAAKCWVTGQELPGGMDEANMERGIQRASARSRQKAANIGGKMNTLVHGSELWKANKFLTYSKPSEGYDHKAVREILMKEARSKRTLGGGKGVTTNSTLAAVMVDLSYGRNGVPQLCELMLAPGVKLLPLGEAVPADGGNALGEGDGAADGPETGSAAVQASRSGQAEVRMPKVRRVETDPLAKKPQQTRVMSVDDLIYSKTCFDALHGVRKLLPNKSDNAAMASLRGKLNILNMGLHEFFSGQYPAWNGSEQCGHEQ